jgi:hypothetical protein
MARRDDRSAHNLLTSFSAFKRTWKPLGFHTHTHTIWMISCVGQFLADKFCGWVYIVSHCFWQNFHHPFSLCLSAGHWLQSPVVELREKEAPNSPPWVKDQCWGSSLKILKDPSVLVLSHPPQDRKNQSTIFHEIIGKKISNSLTFFSNFF